MLEKYNVEGHYKLKKDYTCEVCDGDGGHTGEEMTVKKGTIFQLSGKSWITIYDGVKLDSDNEWLEMDTETFEEYFEGVTG
ncbi:hypothetical protein PM10SUCC1_32740 [Propionigenium maris DSM 9537]|uniref:Uncharacterized protein n=1 Tax=Propionigenium maris DSM 9537 TaxID=1123000 RepID=A0A9W6GP55_9FUSO|nr:hypothetical protein [Propionigenium maris]GLI57760.1 hypothetical protein PM10SUCC1_32740 [Propionigenium maris DSM 9537]